MTKTLKAVYEKGVLRPSEPLPLEEGQTVDVTISAGDEAERNRELVEELRRIAALPLQSPNDGFSGADHDKVLYGGPDARWSPLSTRGRGSRAWSQVMPGTRRSSPT